MELNLTTLIPTLERSNSTESTSLTTESHLLTRVAENETPQPGDIKLQGYFQVVLVMHLKCLSGMTKSFF